MEKTETIEGLGIVVRVVDKVYEIGQRHAKEFKKTMMFHFEKSNSNRRYTAILDSLRVQQGILRQFLKEQEPL